MEPPLVDCPRLQDQRSHPWLLTEPECKNPVGASGPTGSADLIEYLRHNARGYIFSCALPAPQLAAARALLAYLIQNPSLPTRLRALAARMRARLAAAGLRVSGEDSAIIPLFFDTEELTMPRTLAQLTPNYLRVVPSCPAADRDTYSDKYVTSGAEYTLVCGGCHHHSGGVHSPDSPGYCSSQPASSRPSHEPDVSPPTAKP